VNAVRDAGGVAVDPTAELRAAEPGAYLDHDPHPSSKGHAAIAEAVTKALRDPAPRRPSGPLLALPEGRSRAPRPGEWALVGSEYLVTGSDAAGCTTKRIREWVYARCTKRGLGPKPSAVRVLSGGHGETIALAHDGVVTVVAPVVVGDRFEAKLSFAADGSSAAVARRLVVDWTAKDVEPDARIEKDAREVDPPNADDLARLCECFEETTGAKSCDELLASPNPDCAATYGSSCRELLECATGWPLRMPHCKEGDVNAGAELWCYSPCDEEGACAKGTCTEAGVVRLCVDPPSAPGIGAGDGHVAESGSAAAAGPELAPLSEAVIDAAGAIVAACGLDVVEPGDWFEFQTFDICKWKKGEPAAYQGAAAKLAAYAEDHDLPPAARTFADEARLFADWVGLAERSEKTRGTLRLYQDVALAWTALRPDRPVAPDPPHILKLWFEKMDDRWVDYIWSSKRTYAAHRALGTPLRWHTSPQGPFL
jgi:hypothetical protein